MERTKRQTLQKKKVSNQINKIKLAILIGVQINQKKYWNRDCGLLAMDYGSGTTGCIWTINSGMSFFFFFLT